MLALAPEALEDRFLPSAPALTGPAQQFYTLLEANRAQIGAQPLALDARLQASAEAFAAYLGSRGSTYAHVVTINGVVSTPVTRDGGAGFPIQVLADGTWSAEIGEALDAGPQVPNASAALAELLGSPSHRDLITGAGNAFGRIGIAEIDAGLLSHYWVIEMGTYPGAPAELVGHAPAGQAVEAFNAMGFYSMAMADASGLFSMDAPANGGAIRVAAGAHAAMASVIPGYNAAADPMAPNGPPADPALQAAWDYAEYLHRPPRPDELAYWRSRLSLGMSSNDVQVAFLTSGEYRGEHPDFVASLYRDVLFREGRPDELAYWRASSLSSQAIALAFVQAA